MNNRMSINPNEYTLNKNALGRIKIWRIYLKTGQKELLVDKPNLITKQGAGILASAVAGQASSAIDHFYVGFNTASEYTPTIAVTDTVSSFSVLNDNGYLRLPLAFPPSFLTETTYTKPNAPYFTTFITEGSGAFANPSGSFVGHPDIFITTLGLVNAGLTQDNLFSKISFEKIKFNSGFGLAITWGITFRAI